MPFCLPNLSLVYSDITSNTSTIICVNIYQKSIAILNCYTLTTKSQLLLFVANLLEFYLHSDYISMYTCSASPINTNTPSVLKLNFNLFFQ